MTTERTVRRKASFQELMEKYSDTTNEEAPGILYALGAVASSLEEQDNLFNLLSRELQDTAYDFKSTLQTLALKLLTRKFLYILSISSSPDDDSTLSRKKECLALMARRDWHGRLSSRDWETVQKFVAKCFDEEKQRRRGIEEGSSSYTPLFDQAILDRAIINTGNWSLLTDNRRYRVIPRLYVLILRQVAHHQSPEEYQGGTYLPKSGLFRGDYCLYAFERPPAKMLEAGEAERIASDILRLTILCGEGGYNESRREPRSGQIRTILTLVSKVMAEQRNCQVMEPLLFIRK